MFNGVLPRTRSFEQIPRVSYLTLGIVILLYLFTTVHYARHTRLWMDEILTLWLMRLPGPVAIYKALAAGAQATPPAHPVLLYYWSKIAGMGFLPMRIPSIVAGLVTALAVFCLLRRYVHPNVAVFGAALTLTGTLYRFNLQARPYAITVACYTVAVLLWDDLARKPLSRWREACIVVLFAVAIAMHFYSVLYVLSFGLIELLYGIALRRFRLGVWISIVLSGLSIAFWLPLAHELGKLLKVEGGTQYYAAPTFFRLSVIIQNSYLHPQMQKALLLGALAIVLLLLFRGNDESVPPDRDTATVDPRPFFAIIAGTIVLPVTTFVFARVTHGAYNDRYVLPGLVGAALLLSAIGELLPYRSWVAAPMSLLLGLSSLHATQLDAAIPVDLAQVFAHANQPYPFVLAEGQLLFEGLEDMSLQPEQKKRLLYLTLPESYPLKDSTNEHLLEKWKGINPSLPIEGAEAFLARGGCFYLIDTHATADDLTDWLQAKGISPRTQIKVGGADLSEICPVR